MELKIGHHSSEADCEMVLQTWAHIIVSHELMLQLILSIFDLSQEILKLFQKDRQIYEHSIL